MRFGIVTKDANDTSGLVGKVSAYLKDKGHEVFGEEKLAGCQYILCFGGDGTLIHKACEHAHFGVPFVGINTGNLGFLAAVEADEWKSGIDSLLSGKVFISERMSLSVKVGKELYKAVNEAVVKGLYRVIELNIEVGSERFLKVAGDGLIVSTQTGSTAYSLSSGGPIVDADLNCFLLTPVNPIGLPIPSFVLSPEGKIAVRVEKGSDVSLVIDGQEHAKLTVGQVVEFSRGENNIKLVYFDQHHFLRALNAKFGLSTRASG